MSALAEQALRATLYCDHHHPAIQERARALADQADGAAQLARDTFLWVRDQVPFGFDLIRVKASDTLIKGYGACFNKALLLSALLRANGIPAMFCSVAVSRWFMRPYIGWQCRLINHPFHHCLVRVQVGGDWSFADATLDQATYQALYRPLGVDWDIDWRPGQSNQLYAEHVLGENQVHQDLDQTIQENVGNSLLPAPLARAMCRSINRRAWAKIGLDPQGRRP